MENQIKDWLGSGAINIFGLPYAGKDTQGRRLSKAFGAKRLSGGEIIRGSDVPEHVKKAVDAGHLAPTKEYIEIILPYLSRKEFQGRPLILSAVGRWKGEEKGVLEALDESDHPLKAVIHLVLTETELRRRWFNSQSKKDRGERTDDAEHFIETRLKEYRTKTVPVLETYDKLGLLERIDGRGTADEVYERIIERLAKRAEA